MNNTSGQQSEEGHPEVSRRRDGSGLPLVACVRHRSYQNQFGVLRKLIKETGRKWRHGKSPQKATTSISQDIISVVQRIRQTVPPTGIKRDQVKAMSEQLQSGKLAVNLIVGVATFHITEEMKSAIITKQDELKGAITTANKRLIVLEHKVVEMSVVGDDEEEDASVGGKSEALRQLEVELGGLKASQSLMSRLLHMAREEALARAGGNQIRCGATTTFGAQNSGLQAGNIYRGVHEITFGGE